MGVCEGFCRPPKTLCSTVVLFLTLTAVIVGTYGQTQNCSASNAILPSDVTALAKTNECQNVWSTRNYNLNYQLDAASSNLTAVLSVPRGNRWYAMGFNSQGIMIGTTAIIFWLDETTNEPDVGTYFISNELASAIKIDNPGFNYTTAPKVVATTDTLYLVFELQMLPSSNFAYTNFAFGSDGDIPSSTTFGSSQKPHEDAIPIQINFATGSLSVVKSDIPSEARTHGILNIIGWGLLLPAGAIIARYARVWDPAWFYMHAVLQIIGYGFVIAGLVTGFRLEDKVPSLDDLDTHKALAIFLFVLASLQITAGLIRPKKEAKLRRYWNWGHWWLGRTGLLIGAINILVGIHVGDASHKWKVGYGIVLAVELLVVIPLEALLWINYLRSRNEPRLPQTGMQRQRSRAAAVNSTAASPPPPPYEGNAWDPKY